MMWVMIIIVACVAIGSDVYVKRLKFKERTMKIEQQMLDKQLKLEHVKNENFKLETERLRLELQQDLQQSPSKTELLGLKED